VHGHGQPDGAGTCLGQLLQHGPVRFRHDQQQVFGMPDEVCKVERAISLLRPSVAQGQQPRQVPPTIACGGIGDDIGRAIGKDQPRPHRQPKAAAKSSDLAPRNMRADHAGHAVAIGNADPRHAPCVRLPDHLRRMRGPAQEAVIGGRDQFGKGQSGLHANSPCKYQRGSAFSS
jgi:hypothetical protein